MWVIQLVDSIKIDWEPPDTTGSGVLSSLFTFRCLEINLLGAVSSETLVGSLCDYLREQMRPAFFIGVEKIISPLSCALPKPADHSSLTLNFFFVLTENDQACAMHLERKVSSPVRSPGFYSPLKRSCRFLEPCSSEDFFYMEQKQKTERGWRSCRISCNLLCLPFRQIRVLSICQCSPREDSNLHI